MKKLFALSALALLAGCAGFQTQVSGAAGKFNYAVGLVCKLDKKVVPIGQDAAPALAAAVGVALTAVGQPVAGAAVPTVVAAAVDFDKLKAHPAAVALCDGLLGAGSELASAPVAPTAP